MSNRATSELMASSVEELKKIIDVSTIIGEPIQAGEVTLIPVCKVSFGLAVGGSDLPAKSTPKDLYGGGSGAGATIQPIAFLCIQKDGQVRLLQLAEKDSSTADRVVNMVPEVVDKVSSLFNKKKEAPCEPTVTAPTLE